MSALHRKLVGLAGLPPKPSTSILTSSQPKQVGRKRDYTPVSWSLYFDTYKDVVTDQNNHFRVYIKGNEGPVIFFLHGGGFSGLSWAVLSSILNKKISCQCYSVDLRGHGKL
jgi:protein phosphatase methylesterase 1